MDGSVHAAGSKKIWMNGVEGECCDVLLVAFQKANVAHHAQVEDSGSLIPGRCCEAHTTDLLKQHLSDSAFVAVERGQAAGCGSWVPKLDQVIF